MLTFNIPAFDGRFQGHKVNFLSDPVLLSPWCSTTFASKVFSFEVPKYLFFKQKTAYEMLRSLVGSEMCIRDSSNIHSREAFRRQSVTAAAVNGVIMGLGAAGYPLAISSLVRIIEGKSKA